MILGSSLKPLIAIDRITVFPTRASSPFGSAPMHVFLSPNPSHEYSRYEIGSSLWKIVSMRNIRTKLIVKEHVYATRSVLVRRMTDLFLLLT
jgi:hypothetical protein